MLRSHAMGLAGIVLVTLLASALPLVFSDYLTRVCLLVALNGIFVLSLALTNGFTGVFSLGHVGFIAIGAYVSGLLSLTVQQKTSLLPHLPFFIAQIHLPFLGATIVAGLVAALIAVVVGFPLMRLSGNFVSVATMGFLIIVNVILINTPDYTRGARTFTGVPIDANIAWVVGWLTLIFYLLWRLVHSPFGRSMKSVRDDPLAASAIGISVLKTRLTAFVIGAFFAGVGGSIFAHYLGSFSPKTFYFAMTMNIVAMLVLGGMGSLTGALIGVAGVSLLTELLRSVERGFSIGSFQIPAIFGASQIALGFLFILVMIFRPKGIMGDREFTLGFKNRQETSTRGEHHA